MDAAVGPVQVPGLPVANVAVQLQGAVLGQDTHGINAGVDTVGQGKINDAVLASKGDGGFGHMAGQGVEAAALSSGQQHGHDFFLHAVHLLSVSSAGKENVKSGRGALGFPVGAYAFFPAGDFFPLAGAFFSLAGAFLPLAGAAFPDLAPSSFSALGLRTGFFRTQR